MATQAIKSEERPLSNWARADADEIRAVVRRYGGDNPRIGAPVAGADVRSGSQVDVIIDNVRLSLLRLVRLEDELTRLLGAPVNVLLSGEATVRAQSQGGEDPNPL